jgi:hypothetical protein
VASARKESGVVCSYSSATASGQILLANTRTVTFYYTGFYAGRSQRAPRVGEPVDVLFVPSTLVPLAVFAEGAL